MTEPHLAYLSLGTNLGRRRQNLLRAIRLIGEHVGRVVRQSSFHETEPWGFQSTHRFLNACVGVETTLTPRQLLHAWRLSLKHPVTRAPLTFEAPIPQDFGVWPGF